MNKVFLFLCFITTIFSNGISLYAQKSGQIGITAFDVSSGFNIGAIGATYHFSETFALRSFIYLWRGEQKKNELTTNSLSNVDEKTFGLKGMNIGGFYYLKPLDEILPYVGLVLSYSYAPSYLKTGGTAQGTDGAMTDYYQRSFQMFAVAGFQYALTEQISFTANMGMRYSIFSTFQQNIPYEPSNSRYLPAIYKRTTTTFDLFQGGIGLIIYLN